MVGYSSALDTFLHCHPVLTCCINNLFMSVVMVEELRNYILEKIKDQSEAEQKDILMELGSDLHIMAEDLCAD